MTKIAIEIIYGGLRPMDGISLRGENRRGPMPYARTYSERPKDVTSRLTPYCSERYPAEGV